MRIISFSLFGNQKIYNLGAIENARMAPIIYPGWICRFYCDIYTDIEIISQLNKHKAQVYLKSNKNSFYEGLFWRFLPIEDPTIERFICRDADSILNLREKEAVDEWIISPYPSHVMRDHPNHYKQTMAGMWGSVGGLIPNIRDLIKEWSAKDGPAKRTCDEDSCINAFGQLLKKITSLTTVSSIFQK